MSEEYIAFLTKDSEFLDSSKGNAEHKSSEPPKDSKNDTLFSFSLENYLPLLFVFVVILLLGFLFFLNSKHEPKEVAFEDNSNLPGLNLGSILGDKSSKATPSTQLPKTNGPVFDPATLKPSTSGKITFDPPISEGDVIDIYSTTHLLKANLGLNGNYFYLAVYVNGTEQQIYSLSPASGGASLNFDGAVVKVIDNTHDFNKVLLEIDDMNGGENTIRVALFADESQANKLDQVKFTINRANAQDDVSVKFTDVEEMDKKDFFEKIGAEIETDKLWEYLPPVDINWSPFTSKEFYGENSTLGEYKIRKVGSIKINDESKDAYSITYFHSESSKDTGVYILGYIDDSKFYYFPDATKIQNKKDHVLLSYMNSAPVTLKNSIVALTTFDIDVSDGSFYSETAPFVCSSSDRDSGTYATQDEYKIYKNFYIEDPFGLCREYFYRGDYFKGDSFGGVDHISGAYNSDFKKLDIDSDKSIGGYYSMYTYTCSDDEESKELREYDSSFDSHLEEIGETSDDFRVYIIKSSAPKPPNPFSYGLMKYSRAKDESKISDSEWEELLEKQDEDYPLLIIENEFDSYYMFVRSDYVFKEEC